MKRKIAVTFLVGAGIGLSGCQSPSLGGLSIFNRNGSAATGSATPDVGKQKFSGLAQQLTGNEQSAAAALGGSRPAPKSGMFASLTKSTAAGGGALAAKSASGPDDDPLRLDQMPKKIGPSVYVAAARLMETQGKYAEAEVKYREALKASKTDLNAMVGLARLYDRQGEPQKAIEMYREAGQAHPSNGLVFNDLGLCYRRGRQLDKSLAAFRKAVELTPDNAKYRNNLAGALVDAGKSAEAYEQLAAVNSAAVAHFNLAYLLQQKGERAEAIRHLQDAIALDAALTPARDMLAQLSGVSAAPPPAAEQPAPKTAAQMPHQHVAAYGAGAAEQRLYTEAPQVEPSTGAEPPSYHIGDDRRPAAETAQRPVWSSAAWAIPANDSPGTKPLPPIN